jgi:phosphoenolpyruvate phosphomutase
MTGKTLIIYSDILFEGWLIERLRSLNSDFLIVIDNSFRMTAGRNRKLDLVRVREKLASGARVLTYDHLYQVERLNSVVRKEEDDLEFMAEFIGMAMLSRKGSEILKREYRRALSDYEDKPVGEAANMRQASLMHFLQHLIDLGYKVEALLVNSGWMEIHTFDNYKDACSLVK